jgi:hypothetical protein
LADAGQAGTTGTPDRVYRLVDNRDPGEGEFWPEGRRTAQQPAKLDPWERCLWECGTSVWGVLDDAEEVAAQLKKRFWVLLDLTLAPPGAVGIVKTGAKSHHDLIARPSVLRGLRVAEGRVRTHD